MDKEFNDENMSEEERQRAALGGILEFWRKQKQENAEKEIITSIDGVTKIFAKMEKTIYDNYISVGFSEAQALTLTKSKSEIIFKGVFNK